MSINWEVEITNVNIQSKRGDVKATRTDSESALAPRVYSMQNTPLETPADRAKVLDTIKEWDDAVVSKATAVDVFLDGLEQAGKTNLEIWELTR